MSVQSRKQCYEKIEQLRSKPLIVYVTSHRMNASGTMSIDVIPELCDQINALPPNCNAVDLFLVSGGGDGMVAWRTVSMLRERGIKISILVPHMAYSAATLLALGVDEIVMHPFANLGPIDPQIDVHKEAKDGTRNLVRFGFEDLVGYLDFMRNKAGLSDQINLIKALQLFIEEVGPIPIAAAARGTMLSQQLGVKLLRTHTSDRSDDRKYQTIVDKLNKEFFTHGYALNRSEAKEIGLNVVNPPKDLEDAIWECWLEIEQDIKMREPFNPLAALAMSPEYASLISPTPSVKIPIGTPPHIENAIWQNVIGNAILPGVQVEYKKIYALVESKGIQRMYSECGVINGSIANQQGVAASVITKSIGWSNSIDQAIP